MGVYRLRRESGTRDEFFIKWRREGGGGMSFLSAFFVFAAPKFASLKEMSYICSRKR
jgi:hypothetical protein